MKIEIDQLEFEKRSLKWVLYLSINSEQVSIPIEGKTAWRIIKNLANKFTLSGQAEESQYLYYIPTKN